MNRPLKASGSCEDHLRVDELRLVQPLQVYLRRQRAAVAQRHLAARDLLLDRAQHPLVVVVEKRDPVAAGRAAAPVADQAGPAVPRLPEREHGYFAGARRWSNACRLLSVAVDDDDDLVGRQRLREHGQQRAAELLHQQHLLRHQQ